MLTRRTVCSTLLIAALIALQIACSVAVATFVTSCAAPPRQGVALPPLPAWPADFAPARVSPLVVVIKARIRFPGVPVHASDAAYTPVPHAWLVEYLDWTSLAARAAGITYTAETWNCQEFAQSFTLFASLAAAKAGVTLAPLAARIVVEPGGPARHMMAGVVTDRGEFVVEPQPGARVRLTPLADFKHPIRSIVFGDFVP